MQTPTILDQLDLGYTLQFDDTVLVTVTDLRPHLAAPGAPTVTTEDLEHVLKRIASVYDVNEVLDMFQDTGKVILVDSQGNDDFLIEFATVAITARQVPTTRQLPLAI